MIDVLRLAGEALKTDFSGVKIVQKNSVYAKKENNILTIGGKDTPQKLRALTLSFLNKEKEEFEIDQSPAFSKLGIMADTSRGGVMKPCKVKEFILKTAMMGSNQFMLYTEDIYTLKDYPHFGYARGAYTDDELKDIIAYAEDLQVEIIPCIQTLGHMAQYLTWTGETKDFKDTDAVLLCDSEATYEFIEAEIFKMKSLFKTDRIHIGMDEAWDMGLGQYISKFGYGERYDILKRHLSRVVAICEKYSLKPMMWSDMFFRLASPVSEYYDPDIKFPENVRETIPDVELVYWDYYHTDEEFYDKMCQRHFELKDKVIFAGSCYTTRGFLPINELSFNTGIPALKSCIKNGVNEVWTTMWGDDGCETNFFDALYSYAMYSEMCYNPSCTMDDIEKMGSLISGVEIHNAKAAYSYFINPYPKKMIWGDIFYNLTGIDFNKNKEFEKIPVALKNCTDKYTNLVLEILYDKCCIYRDMYKKYKDGDDMTVYCDKILPELTVKYEALFEMFSEKWLDTNKAIGYETIQMRFNTTIGRIKYAIEHIKAYINNEISTIEELEFEPIYGVERKPWYSYTVSGRVADFF